MKYVLNQNKAKYEMAPNDTMHKAFQNTFQNDPDLVLG